MDSICRRLFVNLGYPAFAKVAGRAAEVGRFTLVAAGYDRPEAVGRVVRSSGPLHPSPVMQSVQESDKER